VASAIEPGLPRREALRRAEAAIAASGVDAGPGDARFLLLHSLGIASADLVLAGDRPLSETDASALREALGRRLAGEPVARILGEWEFWSLPFRLSGETLVPRPNTETLVEAGLAALPSGRPARILDLGTGSGCILVALLSECPQALGVGLDRSPGALRTARENALRNGVGGRAAFVAGDWDAPLVGGFDLVVSNPPYIASTEIAGLSAEVRRHDPHAALDGGRDGLDAYRRIVAAGRLLAVGGAMALEVGADQAEVVEALGCAAGLEPTGPRHDLTGHARVVGFRAGGG